MKKEEKILLFESLSFIIRKLNVDREDKDFRETVSRDTYKIDKLVKELRK